jgi:hypothetical protein
VRVKVFDFGNLPDTNRPQWCVNWRSCAPHSIVELKQQSRLRSRLATGGDSRVLQRPLASRPLDNGERSSGELPISAAVRFSLRCWRNGRIRECAEGHSWTCDAGWNRRPSLVLQLSLPHAIRQSSLSPEHFVASSLAWRVEAERRALPQYRRGRHLEHSCPIR